MSGFVRCVLSATATIPCRPMPDSRDDDERPVSAEQVGRAGEAALRAAGGGGVESVSRSDDPGKAYEVEVAQRGREIDVALDEEWAASSTSDHG